MTEPLRTFTSLSIDDTDIIERRHKPPILRCRVRAAGVSVSLELTNPKVILSPEMDVHAIAKHISREWDGLTIRRNITAELVSYGLDFLSEDREDDCTLRASDCVIDEAT